MYAIDVVMKVGGSRLAESLPLPPPPSSAGHRNRLLKTNMFLCPPLFSSPPPPLFLPVSRGLFCFAFLFFCLDMEHATTLYFLYYCTEQTFEML